MVNLRRTLINKDNFDSLITEFSQMLKNRFPNSLFQMTIVGSCAIMLNYDFKTSVADIDVIMESFSLYQDELLKISEKYEFPEYWINNHFMESPGFTEKIYNITALYKVYLDVLQVYYIPQEYLFATKFKAGRTNRNDICDILDMLIECKNKGIDITVQNIQAAYEYLYGSIDSMPDISKVILLEMENGTSCEELHSLFYNASKIVFD